MSEQYRHNHYVPIWLQKRFLPDTGEKKFFYLDLSPDLITCGDGAVRSREGLNRWGPVRCFYEKDLYTTRFVDLFSTEIEEKFFGSIDHLAPKAVKYFQDFSHLRLHPDTFKVFIENMSIQKLRTPKGLAFLKSILNVKSPNQLLIEMQRLQNLFCTTWSECIWAVVDASGSEVKFLLSDHPVTVFN
jgi:hypothetical protein